MGKIIIGCWDCTYCGTDRISGELRDCPNCGHPRDKDVKFYMADPKNYAADQENVNKNPDWLCPFCDSLNPDSATVCSSCGASRDAKTQNYFQNKEKKEAEARKQQTLKETAPAPKSKKGLYIALGVLAVVIALIVFLVIPKSKTMEIESLNWERSVEVEEYREFEESDWTLPADAYDVTSRLELYGYNTVLDHYETRTRQVAVDVFDGYDISYDYKDLGNGRFEEIEHKTPKYRTEYKSETYEEPIYRQDPIYQTKYYYYIMRWVTDHYEETSGVNDEPYFAEVNEDDTHRTGEKKEKYSVTDTDGKTYPTSYDIWKDLSPGEKINASVQMGEIKEVK